ncbi:MAG TPA: septum formation initiator family protein [Acidimicrobiales bacterium]|nr:septum formation initiator family protein [Acidimicrobiales bacterium]
MMLLPKAGAHRRRHKSQRSPARAASSTPTPSTPTPSTRTPSTRTPSTPASILRALPRSLLWLVRSVMRFRPSGRVTGRRRVEQSPFERRRARAVLLVAAVFAFVVVLFTMPWSVLASQRQQLTSDSSQVSDLQAENRVLSAQASQLADPTAVAGLARQDYGLVRPGQRAYDILPPAGSASSTVADAGHVPLNEAPVVPGSRRSQELLGAGVGSATPPISARTSESQSVGERSLSGNSARQSAPPGAGGFWSRVGHTLEFWS